MARAVADLELALGVLAPAARRGGATGADRGLRGGRAPAGLAARAERRCGARPRRSPATSSSRPRRPTPARCAPRWTSSSAPRWRATMPAVVGDRFGELSPYLQEMFSEGRGSGRRARRSISTPRRGLVRYKGGPTREFREHPVAVCPCAPAWRRRSAAAGRPARRRADAPRRQAHARDLRERARAARGLRPGHARRGPRAARRRSADRRARLRALAARARGRARVVARRLAAASRTEPRGRRARARAGCPQDPPPPQAGDHRLLLAERDERGEPGLEPQRERRRLARPSVAWTWPSSSTRAPPLPGSTITSLGCPGR